MEGASKSDYAYIGGVYVGDSWAEDIGEAVFSITIIEDSFFNRTPSNDQYNTLKDNYESQFGDRLLSIAKTQIPGFLALEVKTIGKSKLTQSRTFYVFSEGKAYALDLRSKIELYDSYEPIFIDIMKTFQIVE